MTSPSTLLKISLFGAFLPAGKGCCELMMTWYSPSSIAVTELCRHVNIDPSNLWPVLISVSRHHYICIVCCQLIDSIGRYQLWPALPLGGAGDRSGGGSSENEVRWWSQGSVDIYGAVWWKALLWMGSHECHYTHIVRCHLKMTDSLTKLDSHQWPVAGFPQQTWSTSTRGSDRNNKLDKAPSVNKTNRISADKFVYW